MSQSPEQINDVWEQADPRDLRPHPEFQRLFEPLAPDEAARLTEALAAGRPLRPLVVTAGQEVIAGVEHWQAALDLGWRRISVVRAPALTLAELRALMVAENIASRELRQQHLARAMNNFFDMQPLRPPGGW